MKAGILQGGNDSGYLPPHAATDESDTHTPLSTTMKQALKEWAVICNALATGRQCLLLRAGGIAEKGFQVAHRRFWLFPTYFHEHRRGIRPEESTLLEEAERNRPPNGRVVLTHWAEIAGEYAVKDQETVHRLVDLHVWSPEEVEKRYTYRSPGVIVLGVRVHRAGRTHDIADTTEYQGCRSWVELESDLETEGSVPVVDDAAFAGRLEELVETLKVGSTPS